MFKTNKKYLQVISRNVNNNLLNKMNTSLLICLLGLIIYDTQQVNKINSYNKYINQNNKINQNNQNNQNYVLKNPDTDILFRELNFKEDGTFRIGIISDLNLEKNDYKFLGNLNKTLQINKPDLLIFNGNIISSNCRSLLVIHNLNKVLLFNNVKFIYNFGENENTNIFFKEKLINYLLYTSLNYRESYISMTDQLIRLSFNHNYYYYITLLDSNKYNLKFSQLNYLYNVCKFNKNINGLLLIHKPLYEVKEINSVNSGLLHTINECGNINIIFNGLINQKHCSHLHGNKVCFSSNNIQYLTLENYGRTSYKRKVNLVN